jgi:hypothetical protein
VEGRLDPRLNGNIAPVAWRCEQCRLFQPVAASSHVIVVDDFSTRFTQSGAVRHRARFARKMVVCGPCRRSITEVSNDEE